ncbi:MAG: hypothetical protein ACI4UV_15835 [Victivallales bacterium]
MIGVDPSTFTARELCAMHEERMRDEWNLASAVMAMIHNCAFGVKHPVSPAELNPYTEYKRNYASTEFVAEIFGNAKKSAPVE